MLKDGNVFSADSFSDRVCDVVRVGIVFGGVPSQYWPLPLVGAVLSIVGLF